MFPAALRLSPNRITSLRAIGRGLYNNSIYNSESHIRITRTRRRRIIQLTKLNASKIARRRRRIRLTTTSRNDSLLNATTTSQVRHTRQRANNVVSSFTNRTHNGRIVLERGTRVNDTRLDRRFLTKVINGRNGSRN